VRNFRKTFDFLLKEKKCKVLEKKCLSTKNHPPTPNIRSGIFVPDPPPEYHGNFSEATDFPS
jgi:hypothetical protein